MEYIILNTHLFINDEQVFELQNDIFATAMLVIGSVP